jgi:hypothetical protein
MLVNPEQEGASRKPESQLLRPVGPSIGLRPTKHGDEKVLDRREMMTQEAVQNLVIFTGRFIKT